jgi:ATP-dependent RNA helicase DeaD
MIPTLAKALAERGFETLTDVQQAVTAPELAGADLLVSAQTGSGKTVGFGLAIAPTLIGEGDRFGPPASPLALVIAPTRELALQVQRELAWLFAGASGRVVPCIGGMDPREERRALERGAHIVVGTPGRLRDHITRGALDLADIRAIVLDEADEMLDLGFREDLEFMLGEAPADRRTLMFSATVPPAIAELAKQYQRDAVRVTTLSRGAQHADIAYQAVQVSAADSENAIINLLRFHDAPTAIVFANTRAAVSRLAARLANRGLSVVSLSGELSQEERSHALQAMRDGRARVCVATDVAARGIDLPNLDLVIHADLPSNTEALLHRSGRTGRAGRKGISALIVPDRAAGKAARLLKWAKIEAEWTFAPTREEILALDETRLLSDPVWTGEMTGAEAAFAARLLADHSAEQIASACLRLYRAGLSAPEELNAAAARNTRPDRQPFGPSVWFEVSIGQGRRAEARWLLPLLCRAGNLDKAQIGKIRVLADTTHVEIAEAAAAGLLDRLGPGGVLEDDITARKLDASGDDNPVPRLTEERPQPFKPASVAKRPPEEVAKLATPRPDAPPPPREPEQAQDKPRKPRHAAPGKDHGKAGGAAKASARPRQKSGGTPNKIPVEATNPAKRTDRPKQNANAGPRAGQGDDAPRPKTRLGASDTSKRMERPGGKPGARTGRPAHPKPNRKGGNAPPRRKG